MIGAVARRVSQQGATPRKTIPFDYQFRFALTDTDPERSFVDQLFRQTITVSIEAAFTATSISYALLPSEPARVLFGPGQPQDLEGAQATTSATPTLFARIAATTVRPGSLPDRILPFSVPSIPFRTPPRNLLLWDLVNSLGRKLDESNLRTEVGPRTAAALANGIRLNPRLAQRMLLNGGTDDFTSDELGELFEAMTVPSGPIQFLYGLFDEGTGREFQSELLLNTAGLGKDDGDRPFRHFASPITFAPRTTIRLDMLPKSDFKGELYVVLHGYKTLGTPGTPTGRRLTRR
jgi:hypothetical protein